MVSYSSGEIRLWDIKAGSYSILRNAGAITDSDISSLPAAFSPDGSYVVYASAIDPTMVDIQNIVSKRVLSSIALDDSPTVDGIQSLNISPDSKKLIVSFHNSNHIIWSTAGIILIHLILIFIRPGRACSLVSHAMIIY